MYAKLQKSSMIHSSYGKLPSKLQYYPKLRNSETQKQDDKEISAPVVQAHRQMEEAT